MAFLRWGSRQHGTGERLHGPPAWRTPPDRGARVAPTSPTTSPPPTRRGGPGRRPARRLDLGGEGGPELATQPLASPGQLGRHRGGAVLELLGRPSHRCGGLEHRVALADDTSHPLVDRKRRSTGRMWRQCRCSWIFTAARRIDSRSSKWWNTSRSDTPARWAIRRAVGWASPSSSRAISASARARRVRSPRASRPSSLLCSMIDTASRS